MIHFSLQKKLHSASGNMQLNIDCKIESGQFISLYGPSGAGKTSVLRMLAGLMKPENGFIKMNDDVWFDHEQHIDVTPQRRKVGFVFQDYALFPNMNVKENIGFAVQKNESKNIVDDLLELTGLTMLANRKIQTLSGGQSQRVALARAIAKKPVLLLLDEPLSAIDNTMRQQLQTTLLEVHKRYDLTTILVTHDMDEIVKLADKIIHLEHGTVQQYITPSIFFQDGNTASLTGNIVSVDSDGIVVLINNRLIKAPAEHNVNLKAGDKIELLYNNAVPLIRKL